MDTQPQTSTPLPKLIRARDVLKICPLSKSGLHLAVKAGRFPQPIHISERSIAFVESEVREWLQSRMDQRKGSAA